MTIIISARHIWVVSDVENIFFNLSSSPSPKPNVINLDEPALNALFINNF